MQKIKDFEQRISKHACNMCAVFSFYFIFKLFFGGTVRGKLERALKFRLMEAGAYKFGLLTNMKLCQFYKYGAKLRMFIC